MSKLKLETGENNPILRAMAKDVTDINEKKWMPVIEGMKKIMLKNSGIGIAAPQVGISERLFLMDQLEGENPTNIVTACFNPEILEKSSEMVVSKEGCLSLPGMEGKVLRYASIKVRYTVVSGQTVKVGLTGLSAVLFQHELDHLNGILFIDKLIEKVDYNSRDNVL